MTEPTYAELKARIAVLEGRLAQPTARAPHSSSEKTVVTETPQQVTLKTTHAPPTEKQFTLAQARNTLARRNAKAASPEEIALAIASIKTVIVSGVESAGYGDKRTEFRSLTELRQILADLEEELDEVNGTGFGRIRQIRMTTQRDKGL
jgi:hypothetical protein